MAGSPPAFNDAHMSFQSWIMSGGSWDDAAENSQYTEDNSGIQRWVNELMPGYPAAYTNPYAYTEPYDPFNDGSYLDGFSELSVSLCRQMSSFDPLVVYKDNIVEVGRLADENINDAYIDEMVEAFRLKVADEALNAYSELNVMLSELNAVNTSSRYVGAALLSLDVSRKTASLRAELMRDVAIKKLEWQTSGVATIFEAIRAKHTLSIAAAGVYQQVVTTRQGIIRQYVEDTLRLALENDMFGLKLYDFAEKALSAGLGAGQLPYRQNPTLETISTGTASVAALTPLIMAAFGKLF